MVDWIDRAESSGGQDALHDAIVHAQLRGYRIPPRSATVIDMCASGAMLTTQTESLGVGDEMVLVLGKVQSVATIIWLRREACGVTFHRRLDAATLRGLGWMTRH
jgi:hypothetical protein